MIIKIKHNYWSFAKTIKEFPDTTDHRKTKQTILMTLNLTFRIN